MVAFLQVYLKLASNAPGIVCRVECDSCEMFLCTYAMCSLLLSFIFSCISWIVWIICMLYILQNFCYLIFLTFSDSIYLVSRPKFTLLSLSVNVNSQVLVEGVRCIPKRNPKYQQTQIQKFINLWFAILHWYPISLSIYYFYISASTQQYTH